MSRSRTGMADLLRRKAHILIVTRSRPRGKPEGRRLALPCRFDDCSIGESPGRMLSPAGAPLPDDDPGDRWTRSAIDRRTKHTPETAHERAHLAADGRPRRSPLPGH